MEHRCNVRKPLSLDVLIEHQGLGLVSARTLDISLGGMYIHTGRVRLPSNSIVHISFSLGTDFLSDSYKAKAMVVHKCDTGVGVMFDDLDPNTRSALQEMLFSSMPASSGEMELSPKINACLG